MVAKIGGLQQVKLVIRRITAKNSKPHTCIHFTQVFSPKIYQRQHFMRSRVSIYNTQQQ